MTLSIVQGLLAQSLMQEVSRSSFSGQSTAMRDMAAQARRPPACRRSSVMTSCACSESIDRVQQAQAADAASSPASAAPPPAASPSPTPRARSRPWSPAATRPRGS